MSVREATKLWHDDVRPAPEGWRWAQNNEEAKQILVAFDVVECSLDHDLGADPTDGLYAKGAGEETGLQLVDWMIERDCVPKVVTIHSWNPPAARRMERALIAAGHRPRVRPYQIPLQQPLSPLPPASEARPFGNYDFRLVYRNGEWIVHTAIVPSEGMEIQFSSFKICEDCGAPGDPKAWNGFWVKTLCPLCVNMRQEEKELKR
jgi:hypothetical protein